METLAPALSRDTLLPLSTTALAYVGDAVFELMVRVKLLGDGHPTSSLLHRRTVAQVRAGVQATHARLIAEHLTEEERAVFRRGRNAETRSQPAASTREEYALATALETLWGFLFLTGNRARLEQLFALLPIGNADTATT